MSGPFAVGDQVTVTAKGTGVKRGTTGIIEGYWGESEDILMIRETNGSSFKAHVLAVVHACDYRKYKGNEMSKKLKAGKKAVVMIDCGMFSAGDVVRIIRVDKNDNTALVESDFVVEAIGCSALTARWVPMRNLTRIKKNKPKAQEPQEAAFQQARLINVSGIATCTRKQAESNAFGKLLDLVSSANSGDWVRVKACLDSGSLQAFADALAADDEAQRNVTAE